MRVLGVGHCTLDQFSVVERFPEADTKTEMSQFSVQGGGSAATAMVALSRWSTAAGFIGKVGDDDRGEQIVRTIRDEGVNTDHVVRQAGGISQLSFIVVEAATSKKQTYWTRGTVERLNVDEVDPSVLEGVEVLLVDGTHVDAEIALMRAASEYGVKVVLDASATHPRINEAVALCDYLVASERFASQFAGVGQLKNLCDALLERGPETVIVTLGDEGCVGMNSSDRKMVRQSAFEVDVTDRTGAGDVFHGGVVYGVLQGWDLETTITFANVAAGLTCNGIGGRGAIPSLDEISEHS